MTENDLNATPNSSEPKGTVKDALVTGILQTLVAILGTLLMRRRF